jgi:hypothetical protein
MPSRIQGSKSFFRFDGVPVRGGVKGSSHGAIYRLWQSGAKYDYMVAKSMNYTRWLQIKRMYKLNLNATAMKSGQPGYNPVYKYDYIYKTIMNHTNLFTKEVDLDLCGDETSWDHGGYGGSNWDFLSCDWQTSGDSWWSNCDRV